MLIAAKSSPIKLLRLSHPWSKKFESITRDLPGLFSPTNSLYGTQALAGHWLWITDQWSRNYFHWITDALPRIFALRDAGFEDQIVVPETVAARAFVPTTMGVLGEQFTVLRKHQLHRIEHLTLIGALNPTGHPEEKRMTNLRERLRDSLMIRQTPKKRIWISRQFARRRRIRHEASLFPVLKSFGFEIVYPESLTTVEQLRLFGQAEVVAGPHGAGLTNCIMLQPGAQLIEIQRGPREKNLCFQRLSESLGVLHTAVPGKVNGPWNDFSDITLNADQLRSSLTRALE